MNEFLQDKRTRPIFIHSMIDNMTQLTPNDMRVYMHLARRADNDSGAAWPSYQSIGDHCFASVSDNKATRKSFARTAVDNLIANGLVEKHNRKDAKSGNLSNIYVLVDPVPIGTPRAYSAQPVLNKHQRISNEGYPIEGDDDFAKVTSYLDTNGVAGGEIMFDGYKDIGGRIEPATNGRIGEAVNGRFLYTETSSEISSEIDDDFAKVTSYLDTNGVMGGEIMFDRYKDLVDEHGADVVLAGMRKAQELGKLNVYKYVLRCIDTEANTRKKKVKPPAYTFTEEEQDFLKEMGF
jgi:hypothetical protein